MDRAERRRQAKLDAQLLVRGIDLDRPQDPQPTAAMARQLSDLFEAAKRDGNIEPPIRYLHSKVDATLRSLTDVPVACKKGCSHCCHVWVSATAPEVLFIAKAIRLMSDPTVRDRIKAAYLQTGQFSFEERDLHPYPCPLLVNNICSIYEMRPKACRLAASGNAEICARAIHDLTNEDIPTPFMHMIARSSYAIALAAALKHSQLPYRSYEFIGALERALQRDDAERAWLAGEDIFSDVSRDPNDPFSEPPANMMYRHAFQ
jgi:Fe-S-cluster containining protein